MSDRPESRLKSLSIEDQLDLLTEMNEVGFRTPEVNIFSRGYRSFIEMSDTPTYVVDYEEILLGGIEAGIKSEVAADIFPLSIRSKDRPTVTVLPQSKKVNINAFVPELESNDYRQEFNATLWSGILVLDRFQNQDHKTARQAHDRLDDPRYRRALAAAATFMCSGLATGVLLGDFKYTAAGFALSSASKYAYLKQGIKPHKYLQALKIESAEEAMKLGLKYPILKPLQDLGEN